MLLGRALVGGALPLLCLYGQPQQGMGSATKVQPRQSPKSTAAAAVPTLRIDLRDVARDWGITAPNYYGGVASKKHILEMTGNGVGLVDVNNDGRLDIILVNGSRFAGGPRPSVLYTNEGAGKFRESPLPTTGWSQGVCAADYDRDGFTDLLITAYGGNQLLRNDRTGRFAAQPFPASPGAFNTGCAFLDYDRDGDLDLFAASYVAFSLPDVLKAAKIEPCNWLGISVFCGPRGFATGSNHLYRNDGGGRFTDVSKDAGIALAGLHYGLGVTAADFDGDGWLDIYVACDSTPSILYRNNRNGTFTDVAVPAGVAYGENGEEQGGMGVAVGDYDNDGRLDILRTNFIDETAATLYRNLGEWFFADATVAAGMAVNTRYVAWGAAWIDIDQDGYPDAIAANGHIYPELKSGYAMPRMLYYNLRNGAFRDVSLPLAPATSRGLATGDLDNDGSPEIVIVNHNAPPTVLKNFGERGHWLRVSLKAPDIIGALVRVTAGGLTQTSVVSSGSSYLSQSDFRQHFGLGAAALVDSIDVRWPNGSHTTVQHQAADREVAISAP